MHSEMDYIYCVDNILDDDAENSNENSTFGNKTSVVNNDNKVTKRPKPNLALDLHNKSDLDKDNEKIGFCTHDLGILTSTNAKDTELIECDFDNGEGGSCGNLSKHNAFDGVGDVAFLCKNCQGVVCKNCIEDYSSEEEANN